MRRGRETCRIRLENKTSLYLTENDQHTMNTHQYPSLYRATRLLLLLLLCCTLLAGLSTCLSIAPRKRQRRRLAAAGYRQPRVGAPVFLCRKITGDTPGERRRPAYLYALVIALVWLSRSIGSSDIACPVEGSTARSGVGRAGTGRGARCKRGGGLACGFYTHTYMRAHTTALC